MDHSHVIRPWNSELERDSLRILLVDHETYRIESLARALRLFGHQVFEARTGVEVSEVFSCPDTTIDLVLTDCSSDILCQPQINEAVQKKYSDLPVVVMTDRARWDHEMHSSWRGPAHYIEKPFTVVHLRDVIEGLSVAR